MHGGRAGCIEYAQAAASGVIVFGSAAALHQAQLVPRQCAQPGLCTAIDQVILKEDTLREDALEAAHKGAGCK